MPGPRTRYRYTARFCEENVWLLGQTLVREGVATETLTVLLFTNARRQVVLFNQRAAPPGEPVIWDYHVVLLRCQPPRPARVYDFDSELAFPAPYPDYAAATFPDHLERLPAEWRICLRTIPLAAYLRHFSSDRSHMRGPDGQPRCVFPPYPPIVAPLADRITLQQYLDVDCELPDGSRWWDLAAFTPKALAPPAPQL